MVQNMGSSQPGDCDGVCVTVLLGSVVPFGVCVRVFGRDAGGCEIFEPHFSEQQNFSDKPNFSKGGTWVGKVFLVGRERKSREGMLVHVYLIDCARMNFPFKNISHNCKYVRG